MDHVIGFGVRGISKGIAVTSEMVAGQRRKSSDVAGQPGADRRGSDGDEDFVQTEWELDEIATENESKTTDLQPIASAEADDAVNGLVFKNDISFRPTPLPQVVIIPQRRPRDRSRGFVRAYAPTLGEHAGIPQEIFLTFLNDFDRASRASPIFNVINIACMGIGMVPSTVCFAVSTAVGTAASIAKEIQIRYRSNKYLDRANEELFIPRGLYVMVMTYKPEMSDELLLEADTSDPTSLAVYKSLDDSSNNIFKRKLQQLKTSSGTVKGDEAMPQPAPLIYPSLDRALQAQQTSQGSSSSKDLKKTSSGPLALFNNPVVQEYFDRRAQDDFVHHNPQSKLASTMPPQEKKYVNRFADPNHPVNSGSIFGLLSGGTFDPIAAGRVRRAESKAKRKGEPPLTEEEKHDAYMGRKVRGRVTGTPSKEIPIIGKLLKKDVLYLCVVNLPTEDEIARVRAVLESPA